MKLTRKRQYKKGGPEAAEDAPVLRHANSMGPEGGSNGMEGAARKGRGEGGRGEGENHSEVGPNDSASQVQLNQMLHVPRDRNQCCLFRGRASYPIILASSGSIPVYQYPGTLVYPGTLDTAVSQCTSILVHWDILVHWIRQYPSVPVSWYTGVSWYTVNFG